MMVAENSDRRSEMTEPGGPELVEDYTRAQRLRAVGISVFLIGLLVLISIRIGLWALDHPDESMWIRVSGFALSGLLMFGALRWLFALVRRKLRTGRFLMPQAEAQAIRAATLSKFGAGKPLRPQLWLVLTPWILSAAMVAAAGVLIWLGFNLCQCEGKLDLKLLGAFLLLAMALLALPGILVYKSIQRKRKTGYFLPSEKELEANRAKCARPKSLKQRIVVAGINWIVAALYVGMAIWRHHLHRPPIFGSSWMLPLIWVGVALIWTMQIFSPAVPKRALPPVAPNEPEAKAGLDSGKMDTL